MNKDAKNTTTTTNSGAQNTSQNETKKRCSVKLVEAPLAPHLQSQRLQKEVLLVPYDAENHSLPATYQKTASRQTSDSKLDRSNSKSNTAVALSAFYLNDFSKNTSTSTTSNNNNNNNNTTTDYFSKQKTSNSTTLTDTLQTTSCFQPNQSYYNHHHHPHARRKSVVKLNIEKTLNNLQTNIMKSIQSGFGLASEFMVFPQSNNTTANSSAHENFADQDDQSSHSLNSVKYMDKYLSTSSCVSNNDKSPSSRLASTIYVPYSPIKLLGVHPIDGLRQKSAVTASGERLNATAATFVNTHGNTFYLNTLNNLEYIL